jgi:ferredoxin
VTDHQANQASASKNEASPNVNCLDGKRCPKCGSYCPFEVVVSMRVLLYDNGSDDAENGSIEYDDNALAICHACRYEETFGKFNVR